MTRAAPRGGRRGAPDWALSGLPEPRELGHAPARSGRDAVKRRPPRAEKKGLRRSLARRVDACFFGVGLGAAAALAAPPGAGAFDLEDVAKRAEEQARAPFRPPVGEVPEWLTQITYDQWRDIRFRPETALWKGQGLPFTAQFFHPGLFYNRTVNVNVVDATGVHPVPFSPSHFDYGRNDFASRVPQDLGYAGFRIHYPIKTAAYQDEVIVFLGASYFRAIGRDHLYGLSARGLAIDTVVPSGEEFPNFTEFWLVKPAADAKQMVIHALLDFARAKVANKTHQGLDRCLGKPAALLQRGFSRVPKRARF